MPRGQYPRKKIPTHRFSITFHQSDWPMVRAAARRAKLSVASFLRKCVFDQVGGREHPRQRDKDQPASA